MRSWTGWTPSHVRRYVRSVIRRNGLRTAARLCGTSANTLSKFANGKEITLGAMVRIAENMP